MTTWNHPRIGKGAYANHPLALLCYVRSQCMTSGLTELSCTVAQTEVAEVLGELSVSQFTITQWNVALMHLFQLDRRLTVHREIKAYLKAQGICDATTNAESCRA